MDSKVVVLHRNSDDTDFVSDYGPIKGPFNEFHGGSPGRPCIHLGADAPPATMLFGETHIMGFGWQPVVYLDYEEFVGIWSRIDDIVRMSVDQPHMRTAECNNGQGMPLMELDPDKTWSYKLFHVRFDDAEEVEEDILIGVRTDLLDTEGN